MDPRRAASLRVPCGGAVAHALGAVLSSVLLVALSTSGAAAALNVTGDERVLVDVSRATPANGACPAEPDRTLRTRLWIPGGACGGADPCPPYPLLVMAHGFGGLPEKFEAFATTVAQAGFVVAAPAFPLTNQNTPCGFATGLGDVVEQPQDLTFVFGELLAASTMAADALFGQIDPAALAVLGHSLGGVTVEGLAHSNCCAPPALGAAILVADPFGVASGLGWERVATGPPTLVLHGQPDPVVPFDLAPDLFQSLPQPRYLVGLTDAGHSDLLESQVEPPIAARAAAQSATIAFLNAQARGDASALDTTLGQLAADGHLVFVNAMPVPLLGDPAAWLLACLLVAGGASYLGLRRALAG